MIDLSSISSSSPVEKQIREDVEEFQFPTQNILGSYLSLFVVLLSDSDVRANLEDKNVIVPDEAVETFKNEVVSYLVEKSAESKEPIKEHINLVAEFVSAYEQDAEMAGMYAELDIDFKEDYENAIRMSEATSLSLQDFTDCFSYEEGAFSVIEGIREAMDKQGVAKADISKVDFFNAFFDAYGKDLVVKYPVIGFQLKKLIPSTSIASLQVSPPT